MREGDTLVVTRLDRLARATVHLCQIAAELQRKGVDLQMLDQQIDTTTSTGRLLFHVLGAIVHYETEIRAERQRDGTGHAKAQGVPCGRHKTLSPQRIAALQERRREGAASSALVRDFRVSQATVYRYLHETGADDAVTIIRPAPLDSHLT